MKKVLAFAAVLILLVFSIQSADINIGWDPVGTTNTASGYNIYYGYASKTYTNVVHVGYVTNVVISNLSSNKTIFFSGTTIGANGVETVMGNEVQYVPTVVTNQLPSAVKDFTLVTVTKIIY